MASPPRGRSWAAVLLVLLTASLGLVTVDPRLAAAEVTSISPPSREVDPGETTTAIVTIDYPGTTCVSGAGGVAATFSPVCGDSRWRSTMTVEAPQQPGTHVIEVGHQATNATRRFELRVRAPAPPPPAPTAPPPPPPPPPPPGASSAPPPDTAPSTTAAPPTTVPPETTTTTAAPPPPAPTGEGFVSVADLVERGVPAQGLFLPLTSDGYRSCLPLTRPCVDATSALVVVPARGTEVSWPRAPAGERTAPRLDLRGVAPLLPVGTAPDDAAGHDYALPVLDLASPGGQLRTLLRGIDESGQLATPRVGTSIAIPRAEGPMAAPATATFLASNPFGRPRLAERSDLTDTAPAVPLFASAVSQVVYGIRPDPAWDLGVDFVAFYGPEGVAHLVRAEDGAVGIYVARPEGLRLTRAAATERVDAEPPPGRGGGLPAVAWLAGAVGAGAVATAALAWWRRRRVA